MKAKYEDCIKAIEDMMVERRYDTAKHHISRLMKHYDDMTDTEIEAVEELRIVLLLLSNPSKIPPMSC